MDERKAALVVLLCRSCVMLLDNNYANPKPELHVYRAQHEGGSTHKPTEGSLASRGPNGIRVASAEDRRLGARRDLKGPQKVIVDRMDTSRVLAFRQAKSRVAVNSRFRVV